MPFLSSTDKHGGSIIETDSLIGLLVNCVEDYAIFVLDIEGHIRSWNAGAQLLNGYTADEVIGKHFSIFYLQEDPATRNNPDQELKDAAAAGRIEEDGWRVRKDGSRYWANVLITVLRDEQGKLLGFSVIARDITERLRAVEALHQSEQRFRLLVQSVKDYAIFMLNPEGYITTWNEGAQSIKGYTRDEIVGRHFSTFYPAEDIQSGKPDRELVFAAETGTYVEEGERLRKDGSRFWAYVVITAVRSFEGELLGFAKVTRDLTERRAAYQRALEDARHIAAHEAARIVAERSEKELLSLTRQLQSQTLELERRAAETEAASRAKSEFLAAVSHELRTPLNAIGGYTQLLQMGVSGPLTDEQQEHLERIQLSQQHLLSIINDILNLSRIEARQVVYDIRAVPVQQVIEACILMITPQAGAKSLVLTTHPCPSDLMVKADRSKVEQMLLNLLSNAVKFTVEGGEIEIICQADEEYVRLGVRDTGIGIPEEQVERIFEPFVQVGRSLASPKEGTGLGLAISRDLATAMNGSLTVTSRAGEGSTFTLALPRIIDV